MENKVKVYRVDAVNYILTMKMITYIIYYCKFYNLIAHLYCSSSKTIIFLARNFLSSWNILCLNRDSTKRIRSFILDMRLTMMKKNLRSSQKNLEFIIQLLNIVRSLLQVN